MDQDIQTQNYRPGSQIDMTARLTSYQRSLTVAWGTSIYFRDQICRGKASAKRFQPSKRQKVVTSYWNNDNLFSIFFGIPRKSSQFVNLMISASFAAFAQATGSAQFYLGSVKSPHNTRGQLFFQEKQNCCIPGKFIVIPKHTEREERVPQSNSIGGLPLGCKDWP